MGKISSPKYINNIKNKINHINNDSTNEINNNSVQPNENLVKGILRHFSYFVQMESVKSKILQNVKKIFMWSEIITGICF